MVEGGFAEVAPEVEAIAKGLKGRQATLAEIYQAASAIEATHARAGYILARVSVPPQKLNNGGTLRIAVTDGFIEAIDVSQLSGRVQKQFSQRTHALIGHSHVRLKDIEQALLIAADTPGLELRSTLSRGEKAAGTRLVLEGRHRLVTGRVAMENSLAPSLGRWAATAQVAVNSGLGMGEQIYGFVSGDYRFKHWLSDEPHDRVTGGRLLVPLGDGRITLNAEGVFARTSPDPQPGMPSTTGSFRRLSVRGNIVITQNRQTQSSLSLAVEQISDRNRVPSFDASLHEDRFTAVRLGWSWSDTSSPRARYGLMAQLSQGMGDLGAITLAEAKAHGVPYSRTGASIHFTKLVLTGQAAFALDANTAFTVRTRAQSSFGKALLRAEQFAPEGPDGLSAYVGGRTAVDEGAVARIEVSRRLALESGGNVKRVEVSPYLFASAGTGRINAPTALELRHLSALNIGAGGRFDLPAGLRLSAEYARGFSGYQPLDRVDRLNLGMSVSF